MKNIEFGKAEPVSEWERWKIEGLAGEEATITTPDGKFYHLTADEKLVLEPEKPEPGLKPKAYIIKDGKRILFEEWAQGRAIGQ